MAEDKSKDTPKRDAKGKSPASGGLIQKVQDKSSDYEAPELVKSITASVSQAIAASIANMQGQFGTYDYEEDFEEVEEYDDFWQEEEEDCQPEDSGSQGAKRQKVQGEAFDLMENLLANAKQVVKPTVASPAAPSTSALSPSVPASSYSASVSALIAAVQQDMEEEGTKPAIDAELAKAVDKLITVGLPDDKLKVKLEKYLRPSNCDNMVKVKVNSVIWDHMTPNVRSFDLKLQKAQNLNVKTIVALTEVLVELQKENSGVNNTLFEKALDAISFSAGANKETNLRRRELIKPDIHHDYKALCSTAAHLPITTELFGSDITTAIKDQTEANKISRQLGSSFSGGHGGRRGRGSFRGRRPFYQRQRPFLGGRGRGIFRGRAQYGGQFRGGRGRARGGQQGAQRQPQSQA